ncbi:glutathione S-transferase family protein [Pelagibacteraceae bacterium]|nr:glutathione S-transferase family protein [Pelagibacteraceae bacterium]
MEIKLYYFKIPFWRAEVTRLALFIGDVPFKDYRVEGKEIDNLKETGLLPNNQIAPFKQLPVLDVDGKIIAQTGAIARFCGKLSGLYPKNNDLEAAQIDQIIEAAQDINYLVTLSGRDKEKERLALARKILATKHLPKWFQFLENLLKKNNESYFFVGNKISIADLAIWRLLGWLSSGLLDGVPTNILEPYKKLNKLREEVYKHPKVNEWMLKTYGKKI